MGYLAAIALLAAFMAVPWWLWKLNRRIESMASRLSWLEAQLRRAGVEIRNDDYIKFCLLTCDRSHALSEYRRIYGVSYQEAKTELNKLERQLRR